MKYTLNKKRIKLLLGGFFCIALVLVVKLYVVQIVHGEQLSLKAERQYIRPYAAIFDRGTIFFTDKEGERMSGATLRSGYTLAINPSVITEPSMVYNNLSTVFDLDEEDFIVRVSKADDPYEELGRHITEEEALKVKAMNLEGVHLYKDRWRYYPGDSLASHLLGFMSWREEELKGRYGLERQYEDVLTREGDDVYANFFVEMFSGIGEVLGSKEGQGSLITTIEPEVQSFVEEQLEDMRAEWNTQKAGAIVMNPNTGAIYAMGLSPTFDANKFNEEATLDVFSNSLVEGVYEMGSIMKPISVAIGLDTNAVTPKTTYEDKGQLTSNGFTIFNYDKKARGVVDMQTVLNNSLNTGVSFVVNQVGNDTFANYMKKLFSNKTGVDLPNEASPLVANLDSPRDIELMTASYGQGIAMTPISITRALASLANGGLLVTPHLGDKIKYTSGISKDIAPTETTRVFSEETSETITDMLITVVDEALAGGTVALPRHSIAAKTGTAQMANAQSGGYFEDKFLHSFFGYFPAKNPEFIVFLYHIDPRGADYASQTLTDPFMNITNFLINYYNVPPDR